jgi:hypothetical protein
VTRFSTSTMQMQTFTAGDSDIICGSGARTGCVQCRVQFEVAEAMEQVLGTSDSMQCGFLH